MDTTVRSRLVGTVRSYGTAYQMVPTYHSGNLL